MINLDQDTQMQRPEVDLETLRNTNLLNFVFAVAKCNADGGLRLANVCGLDNLEASLAAAVGREYGILYQDDNYNLRVSIEGKAWALRCVAPMAALFTEQTAIFTGDDQQPDTNAVAL